MIVQPPAGRFPQETSTHDCSASLAATSKVTWRDDDNIARNHSVTDTAAVPTFVAGPLAQGDTASIVFTSGGTLEYHCTFHPGMIGSVIVNP